MTEEKWYDTASFSVNDGGVPYSTSARPVSGPEWIERATMEDDFFFCEVMNSFPRLRCALCSNAEHSRLEG